jgi:hypothetical protein
VSSKTRKQVYVLAALLVVLAAVGMLSLLDGPAATGGGPSNAAGGRAAAQAPPAVADVKVEALRQERDVPSDPTRNLFVFAPKAPPPPPPREPQPEPEETGGPAAPGGPPPPPPIPLKFIGIMEGPGGKGPVAILSDGRGGTFYGREGDTIDGRYRVLKIGTESAELSYVDGRGRQTLRLSGQ